MMSHGKIVKCFLTIAMFTLLFAKTSFATETVASNDISYISENEINLNGNSVIITEAESVSSDSKSTEDFIDIYIDKNRDGIINEGETKVKLEWIDGTNNKIDIPASVKLYGAYKNEYNSPIRITVLSGKLTGSIYGAYGSHVIAGDQDEPAVYVDVQGGSLYEVYGSYGGVIDGNVSVKMRNVTKVTNVYGVSNTCNVKGDLYLDVDKSTFIYMNGMNSSCLVEGDFYFNLGENNEYTSSSYYYAVNYGNSVAGDFKASVYGCKTNDYYPSYYFVYGSVQGAVTIDLNKGYFGTIYGADSGSLIGKDFKLSVNDSFVRYYLYGAYTNGCAGNVDVVLRNCTYGCIYGVYGSGGYTTSSIFKKNVNIDIDDSNKCISYGSNFLIYNASIAGDCTVVYKPQIDTSFSQYYQTLYGLYNSIVEGDFSLDVENTSLSYFYGTYMGSYDYVKGNTKIKLNGCKTTNLIYGTYYGKYYGNVDVDITNNTYANSSGSLYGMYYAYTVDGKATVNITDCKNYSYVVGLYGSAYESYPINSEDITIKNCECTNYDYKYYYGVQGSYCLNDCTINMSNLDPYNFYGSQNNVVLGNETINISDIKMCSVNGYSSYMYCKNNGCTMKKFDLNVNDCTFDKTTFYCMYSALLEGESNISVDGGENGLEIDSSYVYVMYENGGSDAATLDNSIQATFKNVKFTNDTNNAQIENRVCGKQKYVLTFDDSCELPDNYTIYPNEELSSTASATVTYKDSIYYSGVAKNDSDFSYNKADKSGYRNVTFYCTNAELTNNILAENITVNRGVLIIPEGVKVQNTEGGSISINSSSYGTEAVLVEGELAGNVIANSTNTTGDKYSTGNYFINGGKLSFDDMSVATQIYYPYNLKYDNTAISVSYTNTYLLSQRPNLYFARVGSTVPTITCTPKVGYTVDNASITYEGDKTSSILALKTTNATTGIKTFTFDMKKCAADIAINTVGKQIVVAKVKADPVTKLGDVSTKDEPLYDLASLKISNDAKEGTVSFEVDETNKLPEGLVLEDGKIFGKTTKAYEDGKLVKIKVTGKNKSSVYITLNIVVTAGEGQQTNQDGRIHVNETDKRVDLFGNSVVIDEITEDGAKETAIYLDDNGDGIKDSDKPLVAMDLSQYSIYGLEDDENESRPISITMYGGKVNFLFGVLNSTVTYNKEDRPTVSIKVLGGSISALYAVGNKSSIGGDVYVDNTLGCASIATIEYGNASTYKGSFINSMGYVVTNGDYVLNESFDAKSMVLSGSLTIAENVVAKTDKLVINKNVRVYNYGTIDCSANITNNGYIFVMESGNTVGEITDTYQWANVYYPLKVETDKLGTALYSRVSNVVEESINDHIRIFAKAGSEACVNVTDVAGYDYSSKLNDGEVKAQDSNRIYFDMPNKASTLYVYYTAKELSYEKIFEQVVGYTTKTYTETNPLYDYNKLVIKNDSTEATERTYTLKEGSVLPEGLEFVNGKVIGTPANVNEEGVDVTVVVTGHNGKSIEVTMKYSIQEEDLTSAMFDKIKLIDYRLELNGVSVVMYADPSNATYINLYLDLNHDGVADNNIPYMNYYGSATLNLNTVYGYTNSSEALNDDLTIYMHGGYLSTLIGVGNENKSASVNGNVGVYVTGGTVATRLSAGYNATISKDATLKATGGTIAYEVSGLGGKSSVGENFYFAIEDNAKFQTSKDEKVYITNGATIGKNVYANFSTTDSTKGFGSSSRDSFTGVYSSTVKGDVICTVDGYMDLSSLLTFAYNSKITGDITLNVKNNAYLYCNSSNYNNNAIANQCTARNVYLNVGPKVKATINGYRQFCLVQGGTYSGVYCLVDSTASGSYYFKNIGTNLTSTVNDTDVRLYSGELTITKGSYTIDKNMDLRNITVSEGAELIIAEDVKVTSSNSIYTYGKITNNGEVIANSQFAADKKSLIVNNGTLTTNSTANIMGKVENYGTFTVNPYSAGSSSVYLTIQTTSAFYNYSTGTFNLNCCMNNYGVIANNGTFNQTYKGNNYHKLGKVISSNPLGLAYDDRNDIYLMYSQLYYPVTVECPKDYAIVKLGDANGNSLLTSGIADDKNVYVKKGEKFYVYISDVDPNVNISTVTYNYDNTVKNASNLIGDDIVYYGDAACEPTVVTVSFDGEPTKVIELEPASATVESIKVGSYAYVYSLSDNVKITNDSEEGKVSYSLAPNTKLPAGLYLNESSGVISGTPSVASETPTTVLIDVKGKNQSVARFTLTINTIEKGSISISSGAYAGDYRKKLADITLVTNSYGTYKWVNPEQELSEFAGESKKFDAIFVPSASQLNNYDWANAKGGTWNEEKGYVELTIQVNVSKIVPEFERPTEFTAYYNQKLEDIDLSGYTYDNGELVWATPKTTVLKYLRENTYYLNFVPNSGKYQTVQFPVTVNVKPIVVSEVETFDEVEGSEGDETLSDITLPEGVKGSYFWITTADTKVEDGGVYKVGFKPDDSVYYDYTGIEGWSEAHKAVEFDVQVVLFKEGEAKELTISGLPSVITADHGTRLSKIALPVRKFNKQQTNNWYINNVALDSLSVNKVGDIVPSGHYEWEDADVVINTEGTFETTVKYVPDSKKYQTATGIPATIKVNGRHSWTKDQVIEEPTYKNEGIQGLVCELCGAESTEPIEKLLPKDPVFDVPTDLTLVYGQKLSEIDLSVYTNEIGHFEWRSDSSVVYEVGKHDCYLDFVSDTEEYKHAINNKVEVEIKPVVVDKIENFEEITANYEMTLEDINLPTVKNGVYEWMSDLSEYVVNGKTYQVSFVPEDTKNYDYSSVTGWDAENNSVVFDVLMTVVEKDEMTNYKLDELPITITANHGDKLAESKLPVRAINDNQLYAWYLGESEDVEATKVTDVPMGHFEWTDSEAVVNTETEFETTVKFVPVNKKFPVQEDIKVSVKVIGSHTWNDGEITLPATTEKEGEMTYTCTACGNTRIESIDKLPEEVTTEDETTEEITTEEKTTEEITTEEKTTEEITTEEKTTEEITTEEKTTEEITTEEKTTEEITTEEKTTEEITTEEKTTEEITTEEKTTEEITTEEKTTEDETTEEKTTEEITTEEIKVEEPKEPTFEIPTDLAVVYGETFAALDLSIYANEIGHFEWKANSPIYSEFEVGKYICTLNFISDKDEYKSVSDIKVVVSVNPIMIDEVESISELTAYYEMRLMDIELPKASDGVYKWNDDAKTRVVDGKTYKLSFVPNDTKNYDYSTVEGWNEETKMIVFKVTMKVVEKDDLAEYMLDKLPVNIVVFHGKKLAECNLPVRAINDNQVYAWYLNDLEFDNALKVDNIPLGHFEWSNPDVIVTAENELETTVKYVPDNKEFPEQENIKVTVNVKGTHTWNDGEISKPATVDEEGQKLFTCTSCGEVRTESIDKLPQITTEEKTTEEITTEEVTTEEKTTEEVTTEEKTTEEVTTEEVTTEEITTEEVTTEEITTEEITTEEVTTEEVTTEEITTEEVTTEEITTEEVTTEEVTTEEVTTEEITTEEVTTEKKTTEKKTTEKKTTEKKTTEKKTTEEKTTEQKPSAPEKDKKKEKKEGFEYKDSKTNITYVVVKSVDGNPAMALKSSDKKAVSVVIPNTVVLDGVTYEVVEIMQNAFKGNKKLVSVSIPMNVRKIDYAAFMNCKKLKKVAFDVNSKCTEIGNNAFAGCSSISQIKIPNSVTSLGNGCFAKCKKLKTVTTGTDLEVIGAKAFSNCNGMKKITLKSEKIKSVGKQAFKKTGSKKYNKCVIKVPKAKLKQYKKMFKKAGLNKKVKVKK